MHRIEKKGIRYKSADGKNDVSAVLYSPCEKPFCILQISHGLCEYIERYDHFARFMAENGVAVCGNDHLGHGNTAVSPDDYGYFGVRGARAFVLQDIKTMNEWVGDVFPGVPRVILGHSMGSFFARAFAVHWPNQVAGLILSGTSGSNPMLDAGLQAARIMEKTRGARHRSKFLRRLTFGSYLIRIQNPNTRYDWVSSEIEVVRQYVLDPKCNFLFTVSGYYELFSILKEVSGPSWAEKMPKQLPVYLFCGEEDPVADYGRGMLQVEKWLQDAGVTSLSSRQYPGGRHEMLNEKDRLMVYEDVMEFLKHNFEK